jgi:hypothetical protein
LLRGIVHQSDIDFTSYFKFISHSDQIEHFVFDKGIMPLAFLPFSRFWHGDGAQQLGEFLAAEATEGFSHFDALGKVIPPGRPLAKAGPDRLAPDFADVSGAASLFALNYSWTILPGSQSGGTLATPAAIRTRLSGPDGIYLLRLAVSNAAGESSTDDVTVTLATAATDPRALTFDDIRTILQTTPGECVGCHYPPTLPACTLPFPLPPMFWTDPNPITDCASTLNRKLYDDFRSRADFADPENSRVLRKPSGHHHAGGLLTGFDVDNPADRENYDTFLNWILEGGRES